MKGLICTFHKLHSLMTSRVDLLMVVASTEPRCVMRLFLNHGLVDFKNPDPLTRHIKIVHHLALKTRMGEDDWSLSRLMALYSQSSGQRMEPEEYVERLFHNHASRKGGSRSYNLMLEYDNRLFG
ncbi:unnamed protein product [Microthlaspi erraticum]|uniref:Uncharacterized protein n=1 Tax=Microthlaspi erraticum TaxID=1685480 RepID=A0A6D2IJA8_9BRAS|nr:unnamed protein product [Microthlaspi erraticum]